MNLTKIEWTTFSANPLKYRDAAGRVVWGCVHKSAGCINCYSEALARRYARGGPFAAQVMKGLTPFLDDAELRHMATAKRIGGQEVSGGRCFVGDMTDIFGEWVPDDLLKRLFSEVLERRQDVTWQLLTKRADRLQAYLSWRYGEGRIPARNIHVGVSVEDPATADARIPFLLDTPAAVKFVSYEPALALVDFAQPREYGMTYLDGLDWIIVGGESGPGARPFDVAWARSAISQCKAAGCKVFVKQLGARPTCTADEGQGIEVGLDAITKRWSLEAGRHVLLLLDRKGGDVEEWPADLRVRQFPGEARP